MAEDGTSLTTSAARLAKASHTKKQTSKLAATYTDERQHAWGYLCTLRTHSISVSFSNLFLLGLYTVYKKTLEISSNYTLSCLHTLTPNILVSEAYSYTHTHTY